MSNASLILVLKVAVMGTWLAAAAAFLFPDTTLYGRLGRGLFVLLAAVHVVECAVFYGTLKRTGRPLVLEIVNTLFFGVIHYTEAKALVDASESPR